MNEQKMRAEQRYRVLLSMLDHTGRGLHYQAEQSDLKVVLYIPSGLVLTKCTFYVHDDADIITMRISTNVYANDPDAQIRVLTKMNEFNHRCIQGRYHLDPMDNEIMFSDGIRLDTIIPSEEMLRGMLLAGLSSIRYSINDLVREILIQPDQPRKKRSGLEELIGQLRTENGDADDEDIDDEELIASIANELDADADDILVPDDDDLDEAGDDDSDDTPEDGESNGGANNE